MSYPYLIQGKNIVIVVGSKSHTINSTHVNYSKVLEAIKAEDWDAIKDVVEPKKIVLDYGKGYVSIQGDKLFWKDRELHTTLAMRMIEMARDGFPIKPLVLFMENLMKNPSKRAVTELYRFLELGNLPITSDGYFLAYKNVNENYLDIHSRTVLNKVASTLTDEDKESIALPQGKKQEVTVDVSSGETVVSMERNEVDDNKDNTCSEGLHFCSQNYLKSFSADNGHTMILKINPRDVVSIPSDYRDSKGRTCRYTVIGEVGTDVAEGAFSRPVQDNAN